MKHRGFIALASSVMLLAAGCKTDKMTDAGDDSIVKKIDVHDYADLADIIDSWHYVVLETGEHGEGLLGEIWSIDFDDDHIAVRSRVDEIVIYDRNGKLISSINRMGQGPEEYVSAGRIRLHDGLLYVLGNFSPVLQVYNLDGTHVRRYDLPDRYFDFSFFSDNKAVLSAQMCNSSDYDVAVLDLESGKITANYLPKKVDLTNPHFMNFQAVIDSDGENCYVVQPYDHTIYRINDEGVSEYRKFDINTSTTLADLEGLSLKDKYDQVMSEYKPFIDWLRPRYEDKESGTVFQAFHMMEPIINTYVYKETKDGKGQLYRRNTDDYNSNAPFLSNIIAFDKGYYVSTITHSSVRYVEETYNGGKVIIPEDEFDEESNPILVFYHMKN